MTAGPSFEDILGTDRARRVRDLIEAELTRRNLPRQFDGDTLHVKMPGGTPVLISLETLARRLQVPGVDAAEVIEQLFTVNEQAVTGWTDRGPLTEPGRALKIQLRPLSYLDENPDLVWKPWWPGLLLVLVADAGDYVRSVTADELLALGSDRAELERIALRNVWDHNQPRRHLVPGDDSGAVMLEGDLFSSTFALWPDRFCSIEADRGVLVAVPTRNCTLLKPLRQGGSSADVRLFCEWAHMAHTHEAGPVSPSVFWVPGTGAEDGDLTNVVLRVTDRGDGRVDVDVPDEVLARLE